MSFKTFWKKELSQEIDTKKIFQIPNTIKDPSYDKEEIRFLNMESKKETLKLSIFSENLINISEEEKLAHKGEESSKSKINTLAQPEIKEQLHKNQKGKKQKKKKKKKCQSLIEASEDKKDSDSEMYTFFKT